MDIITIRKNRSAGKGLIVQKQTDEEERAELDADIKHAKQAKDKLLNLLESKRNVNTCGRRAVFMNEMIEGECDEKKDVGDNSSGSGNGNGNGNGNVVKRDLKMIIEEARMRSRNSMVERNEYINEINMLEAKHLENNVFPDEHVRKYVADLKQNLQQGFKMANGQHNKYNEYVSEKEYGHTSKEIKKSSACMRSQIKAKNRNMRMTAVPIDVLSQNELDSAEARLSNLNDNTNAKSSRLMQKGLLQ